MFYFAIDLVIVTFFIVLGDTEDVVIFLHQRNRLGDKEGNPYNNQHVTGPQ